MISTRNSARIAGLLYLIVIATGLFSEVFVRQALRVSGDALATAQNILSHEMLYRWGVVADLVNFVVGLPSVLIIYHLFKPVNKFLLQLALIFVLIQTAVIAVNLVNQIAALVILSGNGDVSALQFNQFATLSLLFLNIQAQGYAVGLTFFGCYCLIVGYVILQSQLLPKVLGGLYIISGLGYLVNSFTMLLSKGFVNPVFGYVAIPIFVGELALCLWLLVMGVKEAKSSAPRQ